MKDVRDILAKGPTKATVVLKSGIQVDVRLLPRKSYGAGLLYFTGNKNYNIYLRRIAIEKGYKLNEYGLFDRKTGKMISGKSEEEIFKKLGQRYLRPEEREI
jgi:DNA polymerase (family 10)